MNVSRTLAMTTVMLVATAGACGQGLSNAASGFDDWPTRPSDLRQMSFTQPGRIAETVVEEGDVVEKGDPLIRLDDRREQEEFKILSILAGDRVRIDYAEAALAQAKVDEQILLTAQKRQPGSVTPMEIQHAHLEVKLKEASRDIAVLEQKEKVASRDQRAILLEQMRIKAPMAGRVERIFLKEGESADALEKVIVLVQLDPLWVDMPVSVAKARGVHNGQTAVVQYVEDGIEGKTITGKVVHKAALVESGSNTLTVRVEIPNPEGRPAGERVRVKFIPTTAESKSGKTNVDVVAVTAPTQP